MTGPQFTKTEKYCKITNLFSDPWILSQLLNLFLIFLSEFVGRKEILLLCNIVCLNHSGKDRKSIFCVQRHVKVVCVNSCNLLEKVTWDENKISVPITRIRYEAIISGGSYNFFPRTGTINQIIEQYYFLVSWKPSCRHNSWAFLECEFLVVPVYRLQQSKEKYTMKI